ncbi:MAG: hypothetical protein JNL26_10185 [Gemmatimonadetes bacterium]|nr:hypothetical protein [Gemmatimonadota bacterium]
MSSVAIARPLRHLMVVCGIAFVPGLAEAQRGLPPAPLQVAQCSVQVTGINSGTDEVRTASVQFIEGNRPPAPLTASGGALDIPATNTRVQKQFSRLDPCDAGTVQVTLVLQSSPQKTHVMRLAITPQRRTVDLGDVRRLF